jgi:hypothetical protein
MPYMDSNAQTILLTGAHPQTNVFGLALSAISYRLSAKGIIKKVPGWSLTAINIFNSVPGNDHLLSHHMLEVFTD